MSSTLDTTILIAPLSFKTYYDLCLSSFAEGKTTSLDPYYNTPEILDYAKVNLARMKRLLKTVQLTAELSTALSKIVKPQTWLLLTESWCGDAAQLVPLIAKMAEANPAITLEVFLRDQNLPLMDQFLTNGGRSIPKLIALDNTTNQVLGTWGPRPKAAQQLMDELKAQNLPFPEMATQLHNWYNQDGTLTAQGELTTVIVAWVSAQ